MDQEQIGKFIAELRNEKGMTQSELGERIGVTNKTVSRWENGNYMPDISIITTLCVELHVSANELLCAQRLKDSEFKTKADENLMKALDNIKNIKHENSITDFFTGAGTGLIASCVFSPASIGRIIALLVGIIMIGIGWYRKAKYDKMIFQLLNENHVEI